MWHRTLTLVLLAACLPAGCMKTGGSLSYSAIGAGRGITGKLGRPLGTLLTVEGQLTAGDGTRAGEETTFLQVRRVEGKPLAQPVSLAVEVFPWLSLDLPPAGEDFTCLGYESGGMRGIPEEAFAHMPYVASEAFAFKVHFQIIQRMDSSYCTCLH